jgi:competence protein ComEA
MSFYRVALASALALAIASPVFADDVAPTTTQDTAAVQPADIKINLNTASAKDLMKVKGLNASRARAIVAYRKKHGDFKTTQDLANVKGFKKLNAESLQQITDQVSVN